MPTGSSIGCYVQYTLNDISTIMIGELPYYNKPMNVATYKTSTEMPEELRRALPDIEELKKLL